MFEWKESYSCNISEIDKQHKKLFEIGSELFSLVKSKGNSDNYDEIIKLINELKDYTVYHFSSEEELMEKYGYKELEEHKKIHEVFINKINEIDIMNIDDNQKTITMEILIFIADWIEKHILKVDYMYKDFFNEKGIY